MMSLKEIEINSLLEDFSWLKNYEYVDFETLNEGYKFMLEAILDEEENMIDIRVVRGSYCTYLSRENDFWVFNELRNGNWVAYM